MHMACPIQKLTSPCPFARRMPVLFSPLVDATTHSLASFPAACPCSPLRLPLQDSFLASFLLGWGITIGAGLASYPIDTVRRRMMMTSGQAVKYNSSIDCFKQVGVETCLRAM
jgi:hypothetical protein